MKFKIAGAAFLLSVTFGVMANPETGPVISGYGPVFAVPEGSFNLLPDEKYKVVMDVAAGPEQATDVNRQIETAARFMNMHVRNGIAAENIELAIVLHGSAASATLNAAAHLKNFQVPNPNHDLIQSLGAAGVKIYLCGQTAGYRGYGEDDLLPEVTMAVSAMTAHIRLQQDGYQAILF